MSTSVSPLSAPGAEVPQPRSAAAPQSVSPPHEFRALRSLLHRADSNPAPQHTLLRLIGVPAPLLGLPGLNGAGLNSRTWPDSILSVLPQSANELLTALIGAALPAASRPGIRSTPAADSGPLLQSALDALRKPHRMRLLNSPSRNEVEYLLLQAFPLSELGSARLAKSLQTMLELPAATNPPPLEAAAGQAGVPLQPQLPGAAGAGPEHDVLVPRDSKHPHQTSRPRRPIYWDRKNAQLKQDLGLLEGLSSTFRLLRSFALRLGRAFAKRLRQLPD